MELRDNLLKWASRLEFYRNTNCPFINKKAKHSLCSVFCKYKWHFIGKIIEVINTDGKLWFRKACPCTYSGKNETCSIDVKKCKNFLTPSAILEYAYDTLTELNKLI